MAFLENLMETQVLSQDHTKTVLGTAAEKTRLYGLRVENNDAASDVFLQMFSAASTGAVTLGTTSPDYSVRIPAAGTLLLDFLVQSAPLKHFGKGCVFAVTSTRTGSSAPATNATVHFYFSQV